MSGRPPPRWPICGCPCSRYSGRVIARKQLASRRAGIAARTFIPSSRRPLPLLGRARGHSAFTPTPPRCHTGKGRHSDLEERRMETLVAVMMFSAVLLSMAGVLVLVERLDRRRRATVTRQIALTDAIHRELGAVVAPFLHRARGGRWLVEMTVPVHRPGAVAAILRVTDEFFASPLGGAAERYAMRLTRQQTVT